MNDKNVSPNSANYKSTPPANKKVRNPFDRALIERLHKPICSPGMCKEYEKKCTGSFRWDIDQVCTLLPADIVACNSQFEPSPDPALEKIAEEATDKFFSQEMVMPSPLLSSNKTKPLQTSRDSSTQYTCFKKKDVVMNNVSSQTVLTLPPELPPEIEEILKPFCTFTQDQNMSDEYEITANGSLRMKLFFEEHSDMEHDSEQTDDEMNPKRPPSSYEHHDAPVAVSPILESSPEKSEYLKTESDKEEMNNLNPEERNKHVGNAELNFLPKKSREKYQKAYSLFNNWRLSKGAKTFSESVMLSYFKELSKTRQPTTLWSYYSMLKATIKAKRDVHIENYPKLLAFLKRTSEGHRSQKSRVFTACNIEKFLNEAPDYNFLATKSQVSLVKGMERTFGTPLNKSSKPYRNKILDVVDFGDPCFSPIEFRTPKRDQKSATSSSFTSVSISPVANIVSSDEEKNNFTSPESEAIATCLDCIISEPECEKKGPCFCKKTPNKSILKRSASLKESPPRSRKCSLSFSEKRSLSMSSLHRSKSVQKLDFSMEMSVDGSFNHSQADSESSSPLQKIQKHISPEATWSLMEESSIQHLVKVESLKSLAKEIQSSTKVETAYVLENTPIRGKCKSVILTHEISKIRAPAFLSPLQMSLDNSLDNSDNPLSLEDKKIDFNNVDLKFLSDTSPYNFTGNATKVGDSSSFKRIDSGFNENTYYTNASSYYGSAIKQSELTVTNISKANSNTPLKEISNVPLMRIDSGFRDENSADSMQFYSNDSSMRKMRNFSEALDKENVVTKDFDKFLMQSSSKNEAMSMSDIFNDDVTFNCNFSSTPSKNKVRKAQS